jgi:phage FluMu protein gp41
MGLFDILNQYAKPGAQLSGDVFGHFDSVAQQATPQQLGSGIAAALRSGATSGFGQTIGNLFDRSTSEQKAGLLNEIMRTLGPAAAASAGGGILGRIVGMGAAGSSGPITPTQAAQVSTSDLSTLAAAAHQQDGSIVDQIGTFYAQHPTLVKTLGVAALAVVMSHMSQHA